MTRNRSITLSVLLALLMAVPTAPVLAQGQSGAGLSLPISGALKTVNGAAATGTVSGTLVIKEFVRNANRDGLDAIGTLTATITPTAGAARTIVTRVAWPVNMDATGSPVAAAPEALAVQQAVCEILHLELGPLNLDLLGLVVDLNQVVLDITAVAGAGNLLGNLLCAVVGLLDGGGALTQITGLLNQILGLLG
jgi:hypothetical protein